MADLPVQPLANYGALLGSYGESLADQRNASTNALTAQAQLPKIQADTALTNTQAQGADIANQQALLRMQALKQYVAAQQASAAQTAQPTPAADTSGTSAGGSPFTDDNSLTGAASARLDAGLDQKFRVNKGYSPAEYAQTQAALKLAAITGDDGYVKTAQAQHDLRVQNDAAQSQKHAQDISDTASAVATAPQGTAYAALTAIHPDTAAIVARSVDADPDRPQSWTASQKAQMEERARNYATEFGNKLHQFTGDTYEDKGDGLRNSRTGDKAIGNQAQGIGPRQFAELTTEGKSLVSVPQSDGSEKQVPKWQAAGFKSLDAYVRNSANGAGATAPLHASSIPQQTAGPRPAAAPSQTPPNPAARPAAGAALNPVDRAAYTDPSFKLKTPPVVSGQSATPAALDQQKTTVAKRTELLDDSKQATAAASQAMTYMQAAKQVLDTNGNSTGLSAQTKARVSSAMQALGITDGDFATRYQEVAKYLGNAAIQASKASFPNATQSEVGLQLNELSPSMKMTPNAVRELLDANIRNSRYTLDSAGRVQKFLAAGGDPQQFAPWQERYYPRETAVVERSVSSKAQYDALPSGSAYTFNGRKGVKP